VLTSVFEDARRFQHVRDFVEFCAAFGYERDGRRSEWAYAACGDVAARLRHLFHDDYAGVAVTLADIGRIGGQRPAASPTVWPSEGDTPVLPHRQDRT
jgi:hypothetical protein